MGSFAKLTYHVVFGTKFRQPPLFCFVVVLLANQQQAKPSPITNAYAFLIFPTARAAF